MDFTDIDELASDPEQLKLAADEATARIRRYRASVDAIASLVDSSSATWEGEGAEAFRAVFAIERQRATDILDQFEQYPIKLLEYAGIYDATIQASEQVASGISTFQMA